MDYNNANNSVMDIFQYKVIIQQQDVYKIVANILIDLYLYPMILINGVIQAVMKINNLYKLHKKKIRQQQHVQKAVQNMMITIIILNI